MRVLKEKRLLDGAEEDGKMVIIDFA